MPLLQGQHSLTFVLVLLASVPLQFYLRRNYFAEETVRRGAVIGAKRYVDDWLHWYREWQEWFDDVLPPSEDDYDTYDDDYEERVEDVRGGGGPVQFHVDLGDGLPFIAENDTRGFFGSSSKPRRIRPAKVTFKVGQVLYQSYTGLHCVVVGWDKTLNAPRVWIEAAYGEFEDEVVDQPHYVMLCDMREVENVEDEFQYSAQDELKRPRNGDRRILSAFLDHFFDGFDEKTRRYRMRPWLRKIYPRDQEYSDLDLDPGGDDELDDEDYELDDEDYDDYQWKKCTWQNPSKKKQKENFLPKKWLKKLLLWSNNRRKKSANQNTIKSQIHFIYFIIEI